MRPGVISCAFKIVLLVLAVSLCWEDGVAAEDISIQAQVHPQQAKAGEHMRLIISIEGKANLRQSPQLPDLPDFQVYGGGRSSNFTFINGQVSSTLQFTYVLVPKRAGEFVIGPVKIEHKGTSYATSPMKVTIKSAAQGYSPPSQAQAPSQQPQAAAPSAPPSTAQDLSKRAREAIFITTSVDQKTVYVNEPIILTFKFYSRIPILSQPQYQPPDTSGFWAEDLPPQREFISHIGGQEYRVIEIRQALFPTTAGKLTIGEAGLTVQVQDFQRRMRDPFADSFFRDFFSTGQRVTLRTNPIAVVIKPVPQEGRPADFTGTVGNWSMSASLDRTEAKVGEAITLEIRLFGQGNVKSVGKPRLPQLTGFKVYETVSSSEVQKRENTIKGVKIYRTLLRPEVTGTLSIPVITYSYFNPINSKYEQVKVPPLQLKVLPGEVPEAVPMISAGRQALGAGVRVVAEDIRYLKTSVPVKPEAGPLPPIFWILGFTLPPLFLLCFWGWLRRQDRLLADPRYARRITADRSARLALKKARKACAREDAKDFYSTLAQALTGYLADKLGASRSGVTQREIIRQLHTLGVDPRLMHELTSLFNETDFTRFAPAAYNSLEMKAHLNKAEEILTQLSRVLGKERK